MIYVWLNESTVLQNLIYTLLPGELAQNENSKAAVHLEELLKLNGYK